MVDDAFDGTEDFVRERAQQDPRVRCIHRIGRRGLASACIEGMLASSAPYLAVIDADLQHDETPAARSMLETLRAAATPTSSSRAATWRAAAPASLPPSRVRISRPRAR